jgi:carbamoyl-phosphate synthase large subunit
MKPLNVLITAVSRRVSLVRNFRTALEACGGRVITVDFNTFSPALYFGHIHYTVPLVDDPGYVDALEKIIDKEKVGLVIPTIDNELALWARLKDYFAKKGVQVSISPLPTVDICNDKWKTFEFFRSHQLPFPDTWLPSTLSYQMNFPLFIKPRNGRGSVNSFTVRTKRELDFFIEYVPNPVVQTYLPGKEFTVDAYFAADNRLISYVPRYRLVVRAGVTDRGKTFRNDELRNLIVAIGKKIPFEGAVNIQGKIFKKEITFFEINPRFSGGIQLSTAAGPNFADLLVRECAGEKLKPAIDDYANNYSMTSYEDSIFIDQTGRTRFFYADNQTILPESIHLKLDE